MWCLDSASSTGRPTTTNPNENCGPKTRGAAAYTWHRGGHIEIEGLPARELCLERALAQ